MTSLESPQLNPSWPGEFSAIWFLPPKGSVAEDWNYPARAFSWFLCHMHSYTASFSKYLPLVQETPPPVWTALLCTEPSLGQVGLQLSQVGPQNFSFLVRRIAFFGIWTTVGFGVVGPHFFPDLWPEPWLWWPLD